MSDSCEPVGGGDLPQQLSLHPRAPKAVFPQYLLSLRHWGGNQRNLQSVIGHLGAANSHMVDVDYCDRAWVLVGIQSRASGKIFLCEQPIRSACDYGRFFPRKDGFVQLHLPGQAGGAVCGYRMGQRM